MNQNDFLPPSYEAPATGNTNYMKLEQGENKFRILSKPIVGWIDWTLDKKPLRFTMDAKPEKPIDPEKKVKHFWAFVVWNYKASAVQILEITQSSIQSAITSLSRDSDWGNPLEYDIKIIRTGEKMETEYQVNPVPHKPMSQEIKDAFMEKPIILEKLYKGEDPFSKS